MFTHLTASTTEFYEVPQMPCAALQTSKSNQIRFPVNGSTITFPVRLDFTLKSAESDDIAVNFMRGDNSIYAVGE